MLDESFRRELLVLYRRFVESCDECERRELRRLILDLEVWGQ